MRTISSPVVLAVVIAGALLLPAPAQARVVLVEEAKLKLELPDTWKVSRKQKGRDGKSWVLFVGSQDRQVRVRVRAMPVGKQVDLKAAHARWETKKFEPSVVEQKRNFLTEQKIAGYPALIAGYDAVMIRTKNPYKYKVLVTMLQSSAGWLYNIQGMVQEASFAKREAEMTKVVGSFEILGEAAADAAIQVGPAPAARFAGKTKVLSDQGGLWKLTVPEDYKLGRLSVSDDGKAYTARIASSDRNVKIFIRSKKLAGAAYDLAAHFARYETRMSKKKKHFEGMRELKKLRDQGSRGAYAYEARSYRAFSRRTTNLHPYRLAAAAMWKPNDRVYTITVAAHRDVFAKLGPVILAMLESFSPLAAPAAVAAPGSSPAQGGKK
jgi:hypothetical protein